MQNSYICIVGNTQVNHSIQISDYLLIQMIIKAKYKLMQLQKWCTQKQPNVKRCGTVQNGQCKKRLWNQRGSQNSCDGIGRWQNLITTIQVNLCCLIPASLGISTKFTWNCCLCWELNSSNLPCAAISNENCLYPFCLYVIYSLRR